MAYAILQVGVFSVSTFDGLSAAFPLIDGLAVGFLDLAGWLLV
jgi:hypothetical protein